MSGWGGGPDTGSSKRKVVKWRGRSSVVGSRSIEKGVRKIGLLAKGGESRKYSAKQVKYRPGKEDPGQNGDVQIGILHQDQRTGTGEAEKIRKIHST